MGSCTYKDCTSKRDSFIHMFRYPISDKLRCQQWLINAQKLDHFHEQQLKNRLICEHHFDDESFSNSCLKNRLKFDAVPTLDGPFCGSNNSFNIAQDFEQGCSQNEISVSDNDEIEIEEHDLLQNPNIKRIFPDLSIIKKEILQYEEGLLPCVVKVKQEVIDEMPEHIQNVPPNAPESKPIIQQLIMDHESIAWHPTSDHELITQQNIPDRELIVQGDISQSKPVIQKNTPKYEPIQQHIPESQPTIRQDIPECKPIIRQYVPQHKQHTTASTPITRQHLQQSIVQINTPTTTQQHLPSCNQIVSQHVSPCQQIVPRHVKPCNQNIPQDVRISEQIIPQHVAPCEQTVPQIILEDETFIQQPIDLISTPPFKSKTNKTAQQTPVVTNTRKTTRPSSDNISTHLRFKTFLDSLEDDPLDVNDNSGDSHSKTESQSSNDDISSDSSDLTESGTSSKNFKFVRNNIIILGSKPSNDLPNCSSNKIKPVKVVLTDIRPYLNKSRQFCKTCYILFPSIDALKRHINKIHSPKNEMNKTQESSSNTLISVNNQFECDTCDIKFCSKASLKRHKERLVHRKTSKNINSGFRKNKLDTTLRSETGKSSVSLQANGKTDTSGSYYCSHCTKHFQSHKSLIEHLYTVINPNINKRVSQKPTKKDIVENETVSQKIPCTLCSFKFSNQRELRYHFKEIHIKNAMNANNKHTSNKRSRVEQVHDVGQKNGQQSLNGQSNQENMKHVLGSEKRKKREIIENSDGDKIEDEYSDPDYEYKFSDQETGNEISDLKNDTDIVHENQIYQCFVCSKYRKHFKTFSTHMLDHNINVKGDFDKTVFNPFCKICNSKLADIKSYNSHVIRQHSEIKNKKIELDNKGFQSVLFECMKCNVFFVSAKAAKNHSEHNTIIIEWTCSICSRTFKINDKAFHLKQHKMSKNITAFVLSGSALNRVLCKCLKCAVHFSEDEYVIHSETCELEAPNSVYCKTCDILINKDDMDAHEHSHKYKNLEASDFTIVESALYFVNNVRKATDDKNLLKLGLNFCTTCNCFISDMSKTRKAHSEGRCGVINQRTCKKCGLIFTNKGYLSHKAMHDDVKNLSMQAFKFYDIDTNMQINPPMPKYPECKICKVNFLSKQVIREHQCNQQKFTKCDICGFKFTEVAFKLHMNYHNYKSSSAKKIVIKYENDDVDTEDIGTVSRLEERVLLPVKDMVNRDMVKENVVEKCSSLYSCICCLNILDNYDKVVEHCQVHYGYKESETNEQTKIINNESLSIKFDPFYFRFENNVWVKHIFEKLSSEEIQEEVKDSIYKFECRLLMEVIQPGPSNLIVYKCDVCRLYIDPNNMFSHIGTICKTVKQYPCSKCGLNFYSSVYRTVHEKVHERLGINKESFKIVLFNKKEHQQLNKMMKKSFESFVFYQCRNCESIVEKMQRDQHQCYHAKIYKCPYCGLLFYEQDYESHLVKHKTVNCFDTENIAVIMFGKLDVRKDDALRPSFNGAVYDITLYKCNNCGLCLENKKEISRHTCVDHLDKSICPKCRLYFLKKTLNAHLKLHEKRIELEYRDFCSNIELFNSTIKNDDDESMEVDNSKNNENNNLEQNLKRNSYPKETLYKCNCGLHFLEKGNATRHTSNCQRTKISRQSCFRCNLLFTPGELFNHLLKHHSNKNVKYHYDIIDISR